MIANKDILFDDWLKEHLANETDEYREGYKKEVFKLHLAIQTKELRTDNNEASENLQKSGRIIVNRCQYRIEKC